MNHPDDDSFDAPDDIPCRPDCSKGMRRAADEKMYATVAKMATDMAWHKRIAIICWLLLGAAMVYVILPAAKAVHTDIDANTAAVAKNAADITDLKASRQRRIDRSREDHRICHMEDLK